MRGESFALSTRAGRLGARSDRIRGMGDGKYFYFYFPDLPAGTTTTTNVSVACAPVASVLDIAFGSSHPHTVLSRSSIREPGVCNPEWRERRLISISDAPYQGYLDVHYNGENGNLPRKGDSLRRLASGRLPIIRPGSRRQNIKCIAICMNLGLPMVCWITPRLPCGGNV